jgi:hypothetical protein
MASQLFPTSRRLGKAIREFQLVVERASSTYDQNLECIFGVEMMSKSAPSFCDK